jgi:gas vesicle protein
MDTGKIVLGVVGGIAVGALIGVLFAPEKGSVTRRNISRKGEEYMDDLKDKFNDFLESAEEKFNEVKEMATKHS